VNDLSFPIRLIAKHALLFSVLSITCFSSPYYSIESLHSEMWMACLGEYSIYVGSETGIQELGDTVLITRHYMTPDTNRLKVMKRSFRITRNIVGVSKDSMDAIEILGEKALRFGSYTVPRRYGKEHLLIFSRDGKYLAAHGISWPNKKDSLNQNWKQNFKKRNGFKSGWLWISIGF
jgi:hypothetical protein